MVAYMILMEDSASPVKEVTASRGKVVRTDPIGALYARGRVDHVHHFGDNPREEFGELEDQLINMTTAGYMGEKSPDRADAAVWALTELSQGSTLEIVGFW